MSADRVLKLRMRGSVYRDMWLPVADRLLDEGETDLAEIVSRVGLKRVGGGYRAFVSMTPDQARRLAEYLPPAHAEQIRKLAEAE